MPTVHVIVSDLIFATRITATARRLGVTARVASAAEDVEDARLVLIDLDRDDLDLAAGIARLRAADPPPRIVAFGSHVRADRLREARDAGADEVLPRSVFVQRLPDLLAGA